MWEQETVENYLEQLAAGTATPGGGNGTAIGAAVGAALVSMAANLTMGRRHLVQVEAEMTAVSTEMTRLRQQLLEIAATDSRAFGQVMIALALPKTEPEVREKAVQEAMVAATKAPLTLARLCVEALELAVQATQKANGNAAPDAAVGALLLGAALEGALLNVEVNLAYLPADEFAAEARRIADQLSARGKPLVPGAVAAARARLPQ